MKNATNEEKLYNVLFPFWMILLFPQLWAIVLPGNFIIDSVVFAVSMLCLRLENKKHWYKKCILKIFGLGMLADIIGSLYMLALMLLFKIGNMGDELYLTLPALFISAVLIFDCGSSGHSSSLSLTSAQRLFGRGMARLRRASLVHTARDSSVAA